MIASFALGAGSARAQLVVHAPELLQKDAPPEDLLARASCEGRIDAVDKAFVAGSRVDGYRKLDDTHGAPLFLAVACYGNDDAVRLQIVDKLLVQGADVNAPGEIVFESIPMKMTPLIAAAYNRRPAIVAKLLEHGADPNEPDYSRGGTPIIWAAESNCTACVPLLMKHGADVNRKNTQGLTALYVAALRADDKMINVLLAEGAGVFVRDSSGLGIVEAAPEEHTRELLRMAQRKTVLTMAAWAAAIAFAVGAALYFWFRREAEEPGDTEDAPETV